MNRADKVLVARGLARSRTEAQALIAGGHVFVGETAVGKASQPVPDDAPLRIAAPERARFVSRGGLKLESALRRFGVAVAGRVALDVGASTGGFTDCLLQAGAARVVALDVGHGQMVPALRDDPRVELREGVNARAVRPYDLPQPFELIVADLSFISLTLVLPALAPLLAPGGDLICLVKPQFEVGRERVGRGGIVRDAAARQEALDNVARAARACGLGERGRMDSPIAGGEGNREFLLWLSPAA